MNADRRESLRRKVRLPFQWRAITTPVDHESLGKLFDLPTRARLTGRFAELESDYLHAIRQVREPGAAAALDVLSGRLTALQDALFSEDPVPESRAVQLSERGVEFAAQSHQDCGQWLAVHLVLPLCHHLLCNAQVLRCDSCVGVKGFRIAAQLSDLAVADTRCLIRYLMDNKRN